MQEIIFVTSNDNKLREAETILGVKLRREKLDLAEIQEMDQHKILDFKIRQAYEQLQVPVIVEDAGLFADAWNGFPGPFVKWQAETMGHDIFAAILPKDNRKVMWRVCYGYFDGVEVKVFEGVTEGTFAPERRGENGWGFDPFFIPDGETQTFAEIGERKYEYSARRQAIEKLRDYLHKNNIA
jgi:XTP/dITP diphosphohydrolase